MSSFDRSISFVNTIYTNYLINFISLNIFIILLYIFNLNQLVTEVAVFGSFTILVCQIFSSNSRSLIFSKKNLQPTDVILQRFVFIFPILIFSLIFIYIYKFSDISLITSVLFLIIAQWIYEIILSSKEVKSKKIDYKHLCFYFVALLTIVISLYYKNLFFIKIAINVLSLYLFFEIYKYLNSIKFNIKINTLDLKSWFASFLFSSFGSSLAISASNFFFRFFVVILNNVEISSVLIIGFMFGSLPISLFTNIFGPSIIREKIKFQSLIKKFNFIFILVLFVILYFIFNYLVNINSQVYLNSELLLFTIGLSFLGFYPMILGLYKRQFFIQRSLKENFFYLDMVYSVAVITVIPAIYVLSNTNYFAFSFLITSILSFIIYFFSKNMVKKNFIKILVFLLPIPLFLSFFNGLKKFEISIFSTADIDMINHIYSLPFPISILVVPLLTLVLFSTIRFRIYTIYFFVFSFIISISSILFTQRLTFLNSLNLIQFYLPMAAIICGEIIGKLKDYRDFFFRVIFFISLTVIGLDIFSQVIPKQTLEIFLLSNFQIFSDFQYSIFPLIIALLFFLNNYYKKINRINFQLILIIFILFTYIIINEWFSLTLFLIIFFVTISFQNQFHFKKVVFSIFLIFLVSFFLLLKFDELLNFTEKLFYYSAEYRYQSYVIFLEEIFKNFKNFFLGSNVNNLIYLEVPGIFNYYLDFIYNFGFLSLLPIIALIYITIKYSFDSKNKINFNFENTLFFSLFLYMTFIDSNLQVAFKQPYAGVILYFYWGLYISKILKK